MAITQKVTLDQEEIYIALAEYLKKTYSIDIHDEADVVFPDKADAIKYIEINY